MRGLSQGRAELSEGGAACVLVAGDHRPRVEILSRTLKAAGYAVIEAYSVARAARHVADGGDEPDVDLIVLDGSDRPWVAAAVVTALRSAGCELPILLVLGDEPRMRAEIGDRHARIVDAPPNPDEVRDAARELLSGVRSGAEDGVSSAECRANALDMLAARVPVG